MLVKPGDTSRLRAYVYLTAFQARVYGPFQLLRDNHTIQPKHAIGALRGCGKRPRAQEHTITTLLLLRRWHVNTERKDGHNTVHELPFPLDRH
jgi:hypothetical protein